MLVADNICRQKVACETAFWPPFQRIESADHDRF
jgi:hypothetical protein